MVRTTGEALRFTVLIGLVALAATVAPPVAAQEENEPVATPVAATPAPAEPAAATAPPVFREKTLVQIDGKAERDGAIEFLVQPENEEPKMVTVNIVAKTKTKKITEAVTAQLDFALGDRYKVKQSSDTKIRVSLSGKHSPLVSITLAGQSLPGVGVMIGKG
ncbi:MAG: hypothetical protein MUC56_08080 [Thermoanaerobaculales bacterium]|nr:hypothetical protein [Thermoanaerobaculales bacterium]